MKHKHMYIYSHLLGLKYLLLYLMRRGRDRLENINRRKYLKSDRSSLGGKIIGDLNFSLYFIYVVNTIYISIIYINLLCFPSSCMSVRVFYNQEHNSN